MEQVFVEFATSEQATAASVATDGRQFGPNVVRVSYFSLADYAARRFA